MRDTENRDIKAIFGSNVRKYCEREGLTLVDIIEKTKINPESIKAILEGKNDADLITVCAIAEALNTQPHELLLPDGYEAVKIE